MTSISALSVTYAWFVWGVSLGRNQFESGNLDSTFSAQRWINSAWQNSNSAFYLGEMNTISQLPPDSFTYFKFNAQDASSAQTHYNVILEDLELSITNDDGTFTFPELNYFESDPSLQAFDYYLHYGNDNLNPTIVFSDLSSMDKYHLTNRQQTLSPSFFGLDNYIYLRLEIRLDELQSMVNVIPIEYTPYSINFDITFSLEVRTIDAE